MHVLVQIQQVLRETLGKMGIAYGGIASLTFTEGSVIVSTVFNYFSEQKNLSGNADEFKSSLTTLLPTINITDFEFCSDKCKLLFCHVMPAVLDGNIVDMLSLCYVDGLWLNIDR